MSRASLAMGLVFAMVLFAACSDDEESVRPTIGPPQCEGSVVRRVDGGNPVADALPPLESVITQLSAAEAAFAQAEPQIRDRYDVTAVELSDGFGRAWTGENGGDYDVVNVDDFGILVTLASADACPRDSALHVAEAGLPLFFFAP